MAQTQRFRVEAPTAKRQEPRNEGGVADFVAFLESLPAGEWALYDPAAKSPGTGYYLKRKLTEHFGADAIEVTQRGGVNGPWRVYGRLTTDG